MDKLKHNDKFDFKVYKDHAFQDKLLVFQQQINKFKIDWQKGSDCLVLTRTNFLKESIEQWGKINPHKELKINFKGEISHDAGGLIREWFTIILKEYQNPHRNWFEIADNDEITFLISKNASMSNETLDYFNFFGKVIGKALLDNFTINCCLNKLIYKQILNEDILFDDLVFIDKSVNLLI